MARNDSSSEATFVAPAVLKSDENNSMNQNGPRAHGTLIPGLREGRFQLTLVGQSGENYLIEASEDLHLWTRLQAIKLTSGTHTFEDALVTAASRKFYRAVFRPSKVSISMIKRTAQD
jgi:hypothetical protein